MEILCINRLFFILLFFSLHTSLQAKIDEPIKKHYDLVNDPIDVIIVTHPKDKETINACINGIKENCPEVRRIIHVSSERLTDQCQWFDENNFPFGIEDVALAVGRGSKAKGDKFFKGHCRYPGWYFQQLLKLYSPYVIPEISSNVLVVDSDTIFMNPVTFLNESNGGLFCFSNLRAKKVFYFC